MGPHATLDPRQKNISYFFCAKLGQLGNRTCGSMSALACTPQPKVCAVRSANTGQLRDANPLRANVKKLHHLVDHLCFVRALDIMVCVRNAHDAGGWNSLCEAFGSCRAGRRIRAACSFWATFFSDLQLVLIAHSLLVFCESRNSSSHKRHCAAMETGTRRAVCYFIGEKSVGRMYTTSIFSTVLLACSDLITS